MEHIYIDNQSDKTLVLFHGTGGNEKVLLPIARQVAPSMNYLALRGEVVSFGKRRFSKVDYEDQLVNEQDLFQRIPGIHQEIIRLKEKYDLQTLWGMGFSNGAMTLTALILQAENLFERVVLLRPLDCQNNPGNPQLQKLPILIHSGKHDPITPSISAVRLEQRLLKAGALVQHKIYPLDHRMKMNEVEDLKVWFEKELEK